jgi:hypothetical protein
MPAQAQFYDYRTALAERLEEIAVATVDANDAISTADSIERLLMGDFPAFTTYAILFGDRTVEIPLDVPKGYAKSYIDWELILVAKGQVAFTPDVLDFCYQKLHHYHFPVENELQVPIDRALTCYFEGWDPEERLTDELRMVPFHIRIVTLDQLV